MERNVMGELNLYRERGVKPNFSEIGRRYGIDRHTVARYGAEGKDLDDRRVGRPNRFDAHRKIIEEKAAMPSARKKSVHEYLLHRLGDPLLPGYSTFTHYCRTRAIHFAEQGKAEPHPRFETPPGRQLQFDWKGASTETQRHPISQHPQ